LCGCVASPFARLSFPFLGLAFPPLCSVFVLRLFFPFISFSSFSFAVFLTRFSLNFFLFRLSFSLISNLFRVRLVLLLLRSRWETFCVCFVYDVDD